MADQPKILGQSAPAATTLTDLYTVPGSTNTVVSTVTICNTGSTDTTFRLSVAPAGAADALSQYLYRDETVAANDTFVLTAGLTLQATDKLRCYSANGNCSFVAFGIEIT